MSVLAGVIAGAKQRPGGGGGGLPDLIVTGVEWSTDDGGTWHTNIVAQGSNVWFRATIQNIGAAATPGGVIHGIAFRVGGTMRSWSDDNTTSLGASATRTQAANGGPVADGSNKTWDNAPSGTFTVEAWVDDVNRIVESDEGNNTFSTSITVSGGTGIQALEADALIESVAVASRFNGSAYQNLFTTLKTRLADAGIRYIRDSVLCFTSANAPFIVELYNDLGIKGIYATGLSGNNWPATAYANAQANVGFEKIAGLLGVNEPGLGNATVQETWDVQVNLWNTWRVNGVAAAQAVEIWSCSPAPLSNAQELWDYGLTQSTNGWVDVCDGGQTHPYPAGGHPEANRVPPYGSPGLLWNMENIGEVIGGVGRPQGAYEAGYRFTPDTHSNVVPYSVGAIYIPRLYLYNQIAILPSGSRSTRYGYFQFMQTHNGWKLLETNAAVTPMYTALRNLMNLLADPGISFTPGLLDYELSGSMTNVLHVLFQKRNGVFYLAIWLGVSIYNQSTDQLITITPQSVTLSLSPAVSEIARNFPNDNQTWTVIGTNTSSQALSVTERAQLLRITP